MRERIFLIKLWESRCASQLASAFHSWSTDYILASFLLFYLAY